MQIIKNIFDLNKANINSHRLGFVPTMGGIHKGHIHLIKNSQKKSKKTIVSIYINPKQFNNKNDFVSYPKNFKKDIKILRKLNVDYIFIPNTKDIFQKKFKDIRIKSSDKILCAKHRKGHFEGVLNVMNRLMYLIKSKNIFMGEKDFQQLFIIRKYLSKKYNVRIINCKTIRDKNGIALSTRNNLLSKSQYSRVVKIVKELKYLKKKLILKKKLLKIYIKNTINKLEKLYKIKIEYLEIRNENNLRLPKSNEKKRLFVAFWIEKIRLIDNYSL